jgi:hypothetical protein
VYGGCVRELHQRRYHHFATCKKYSLLRKSKIRTLNMPKTGNLGQTFTSSPLNEFNFDNQVAVRM